MTILIWLRGIINNLKCNVSIRDHYCLCYSPYSLENTLTVYPVVHLEYISRNPVHLFSFFFSPGGLLVWLIFKGFRMGHLCLLYILSFFSESLSSQRLLFPVLIYHFPLVSYFSQIFMLRNKHCSWILIKTVVIESPHKKVNLISHEHIWLFSHLHMPS